MDLPRGDPPCVDHANFGRSEGAGITRDGVNVVREKGGWLNIEALENRLTLRFFDAEKQPQAPDVERGSARVVSPSRDDHRVVLSRDGDALLSPAKIRPPWVFRIHLVLYREGDSAAESFVIHYPDRKKQ